MHLGRNITERCCFISLHPIKWHMILICPIIDHIHLCHSVKLLPDKFLNCEITFFLCNKYFCGSSLKLYENLIPHQNSSLFIYLYLCELRVVHFVQYVIIPLHHYFDAQIVLNLASRSPFKLTSGSFCMRPGVLRFMGSQRVGHD